MRNLHTQKNFPLQSIYSLYQQGLIKIESKKPRISKKKLAALKNIIENWLPLPAILFVGDISATTNIATICIGRQDLLHYIIHLLNKEKEFQNKVYAITCEIVAEVPENDLELLKDFWA